MRRALALLAILPLLAISHGPARADHLRGAASFKFGPDCKRLYRATGKPTLYVGTVLGGQNRRGRWGNGTRRDYRTYQACFTTLARCERWTARNAAHHGKPPGYARCTQVYVGLEPPPRAPAFWQRIIPVGY